MELIVPANLTERFRLDLADSRLLRRLARERKTSKSAVLREGLHRLAEEQERLQRRQGAIDYLLAMADAVPGRADDTRWPLRPMRIILDTGVLWDKPALERLRRETRPIVLPAVAFTERARQFVRQGRSVEELWRQLEAGGFGVEAFSAENGLRYAARLDDARWSRLARDALIAGHVGPDDILWTQNPKDFLALGLPPGQVVGIGVPAPAAPPQT